MGVWLLAGANPPDTAENLGQCPQATFSFIGGKILGGQVMKVKIMISQSYIAFSVTLQFCTGVNEITPHQHRSDLTEGSGLRFPPESK